MRQSVKYLSASEAAISFHARSRSERTRLKRDQIGPSIVPPDIIISTPFELYNEICVGSLCSEERGSVRHVAGPLMEELEKIENGKINSINAIEPSSRDKIEFKPRNRVSHFRENAKLFLFIWQVFFLLR